MKHPFTFLFIMFAKVLEWLSFAYQILCVLAHYHVPFYIPARRS